MSRHIVHVPDASADGDWPPAPSICTRCQELGFRDAVFRRRPWSPDRPATCPQGHEAWAESPAYFDWRHIKKTGRKKHGVTGDRVWLELAKSARDPRFRDEVSDYLARLYAGDLFRRKDARSLLGVLQVLTPTVKARGIASETGIAPSSLYEWKRRGLEVLGQKYQYPTEDDMNTLEKIAADVREIKEDVKVLRDFHPTPAEEAERITAREVGLDADLFTQTDDQN